MSHGAFKVVEVVRQDSEQEEKQGRKGDVMISWIQKSKTTRNETGGGMESCVYASLLTKPPPYPSPDFAAAMPRMMTMMRVKVIKIQINHAKPSTAFN